MAAHMPGDPDADGQFVRLDDGDMHVVEDGRQAGSGSWVQFPADGLIPGAIVVPRNSLEWRCDPASQWRHPAITRQDLHIILICDQGYQSSLAAATLQKLGLIHATDLDGGFTAWAAAGLPRIAPPAVGQDRSASRHLDALPR